MTNQQTRDQQRISANFFNWDTDWRTPGGDLPDLTTEPGVALWIYWLKAEIVSRGWSYSIIVDGPSARVSLHFPDGRIFDRNGKSELEALEAVILMTMRRDE